MLSLYLYNINTIHYNDIVILLYQQQNKATPAGEVNGSRERATGAAEKVRAELKHQITKGNKKTWQNLQNLITQAKRENITSTTTEPRPT